MAEDQFVPRTPKLNHYAPVVVTRCERHVEGIGRSRLLQQQISALHDVMKASSNFHEKHIALVSMPTGSGKTGVIACLPYYLGNIRTDSAQPRYLFDKPILVIAPNLAILAQLKQELTVTGDSRQPFLTRTDIVPQEDQKHVLPYPLIIEKTSEVGNQQYLAAFEIVIANAQKFLADNWEQNLPDDLFRLVIVDEAHHHPAPTWCRIVEKFRNPDCPVVFFTATPKRTDGKSVFPPDKSCIAHHLPLRCAVEAGIIRKTHFDALDEVPDELPQTFSRDPENLTEEVANNIRRMIPILSKVKELLDQKRQFTVDRPEVPHMAIAITKNVDYADKLLKLWQTFYPDEPAESYYSEKNLHDKTEIMRKIKNNELSLVVVVAMLLEGFDHPPISIAAITCKIQSPVRFVQFVGRAQRVYRRDGYTEDQGLLANIVTHEDYEQQTNYDDFKNETLIPKTDQENVDELN